MNKYYIAVDIGASSGRHILGWLDNGCIKIEEIHRFKNKIVERNGHLCWDTSYLLNEIVTGLKKCKGKEKIPSYMGIDTWGVDFVLLDKNGKLAGDSVSYRDSRTDGIDIAVNKIISEEDLYSRTGIQKMKFNSIYQLMSIKKNNPQIIDSAEDFLMLPDYFNFLLTGKKINEYTNATTTQLINAQSKSWDWELIEKLGLKKELFKEITKPAFLLGNLKKEIINEVGFNAEVVSVSSHDTASSIMAVTNNDGIFISSGTWSLMGVESETANCSDESRKCNMTNEGGFGNKFCYLKNIMGLWIIQRIQAECAGNLSFNELCSLAEKNINFPSRINVNENRFLAPENMIFEIQKYCEETGQKVPVSAGELAVAAYQSLSDSYVQTASEIENLTYKNFSKIYIVGGGSKDVFLNKLTVQKTGKEVVTGPVESTAIGNLAAQMICSGCFSDINKARAAIRESGSL